ncbi:MAG TPA: class I SAM-dependent methyltransferase [Syntrophorhabdaceae bacterium]|nr:class I SAM-dependent methyltransferase [Syntrophorhabdaceae bacterium]
MDSKERFSDRVDAYRKYRPRYPDEIADTLKSKCNLNARTVVADIGSGTGIFSELLVDHCDRVYAVEPNQNMRQAAQENLSKYTNFISIDGSAESTNLAAKSVDIVCAAQSFHWFDEEKTQQEFSRILRGEKWVILIWNDRIAHGDDFNAAYNDLLRQFFSQERKANRKMINEEVIGKFYGSSGCEISTMYNYQELDLDGLKGRFLSSSYTPKESSRYHASALNKLKDIFHEYQQDGHVVIKYNTKVYYGRII